MTIALMETDQPITDFVRASKAAPPPLCPFPESLSTGVEGVALGTRTLCPAPIPGETQTAITSLSKPLRDGGGDSTPGLKGLPGAIAIVAADVCNDAGGVRWCRRCRSAHGAWHASCPRCGGVLVAVPRTGRRVKTEAA